MYSKGTKKGTIKFSLKAAKGAKKVQVAGGFNQWKGEAMTKQKDGSFAKTLTLKNGAYEYKFIVDGNWMVDPENNQWAMNSYGTMNSVAQVI